MRRFVDLNRADLASVAALIGAAGAARLLAERARTGGFGSWLDAGLASGIGEATLRALADRADAVTPEAPRALVWATGHAGTRARDLETGAIAVDLARPGRALAHGPGFVALLTDAGVVALDADGAQTGSLEGRFDGVAADPAGVLVWGEGGLGRWTGDALERLCDPPVRAAAWAEGLWTLTERALRGPDGGEAALPPGLEPQALTPAGSGCWVLGTAEGAPVAWRPGADPVAVLAGPCCGLPDGGIATADGARLRLLDAGGATRRDVLLPAAVAALGVSDALWWVDAAGEAARWGEDGPRRCPGEDPLEGAVALAPPPEVPGVAGALELTNPGTRVATVQIDLRREGGGAAHGEPIVRKVPAGGRVRLDLEDQVLAPGAFSIVLRADRPVTAAWQGQPLGAPRAEGSLDAGVGVLLNPSAQPVTVALDGQTLVLRPRERRSLSLSAPARWQAGAPIGAWPAPEGGETGTLLVGRGGQQRRDRRMDLGQASAAELEALPGVGPQLARAIAGSAASGELQQTADLLGVPGVGERRLLENVGLVRVGWAVVSLTDAVDPPASGVPLRPDAPGAVRFRVPGEFVDPRTGAFTLLEEDLVVQGRAGMELAIGRVYQPRRAVESGWPDDGLPPGWSLDLPRLGEGLLFHGCVALRLPKEYTVFEPAGDPIRLIAKPTDGPAGNVARLEDGLLCWWFDDQGRPVLVAQTPELNGVALTWSGRRLLRFTVAPDDEVVSLWDGDLLVGWHHPATDRLVRYVQESDANGRRLVTVGQPGPIVTNYRWVESPDHVCLGVIETSGGGDHRLSWRVDDEVPTVSARQWWTRPIDGVRACHRDETWTPSGDGATLIHVRGDARMEATYAPRGVGTEAPWDLVRWAVWSRGETQGFTRETALRWVEHEPDPVHGHPLLSAEWRRGAAVLSTLRTYEGPEARLGLPCTVRLLDPDGFCLRETRTTYGGPRPGLATREWGDVPAVVETTWQGALGTGLPVRAVAERIDPEQLALETTWGWDAHGNLTSTLHPDGQVDSLTWVARGALSDAVNDRVTRRDDKGSFTWTEQVGPGWVRATDPEDVWEELHYDLAGRLIQRVDESGPIETRTIDEEADQVTITRAGRATLVQQGDGLGGLVWEEERDGAVRRRWQRELDHEARPIRLQAPGRGAMTLEWDALGRVTSEQYPDGTRRRHRYDDQVAVHTVGGEPLIADREEVTGPGEFVREVFRDRLDRIVAVRERLDLEERIWRWTWNSAGQLVLQVEPGGATTAFAYDTAGRLLSVGDQETRALDEAGRVLAVTDADGLTTRFTYDALGRCVTRTEPDGGRHTWEYSATERLHRSPSGAVTVTRRGTDGGFAWEDADGVRTRARTTITDAGARLDLSGGGLPDATVLYDRFGDAVQIDLPGASMGITRDAAGRTTAITDPSGAWRFDYDAETGLLCRAEGQGVARTLSWEDGVLREASDARLLQLKLNHFGTEARFEEGDKPLEIWRVRPDGGAWSVTDGDGVTEGADWDPQARALTVRGPECDATLRYSPGGRLESIFDGVGTTRLTRDDAGRVSALTDPTGRERRLSYDADGQLAGVQSAWGDRTLKRTPAGRLVGVSLGEGTGAFCTFDADGRLETIGHAEDLSDAARLVWGPDGRLASITDADGHGARLRWEPEALEIEDAEGGVWTVAADETGRVSELRRGERVIGRWTYDDAQDRCTFTDVAGRARTFTRDPRGRIIASQGDDGDLGLVWTDGDRPRSALLPTGGRIDFDYDERGRLKGSTSSTPNPEGGETAGPWESYRYDDAGRLRGVLRPGDASVEIHRDDAGRVEAILGADGQTLRSVEREPGAVTIRSPDSALRFVADAAGRVVRQEASGAVPSTLTRSYTASGHTRSIEIEGYRIGYRRSAAGRIEALEVSGPGGADPVTVTMSWDGLGRLTRRLLAPAGEETRTYDDAAGTVEQRAGSDWHYHCTVTWTNFGKLQVNAFPMPPLRRVWRCGDPNAVEVTWTGARAQWTGSNDGPDIPRPPALPGDLQTEDRALLTRDGARVEQTTWARGEPAQGRRLLLDATGQPCEITRWRDIGDDEPLEATVRVGTDGLGFPMSTDSAELQRDEADRLTFVRYNFESERRGREVIQDSSWLSLASDGLNQVIAAVQGTPPATLRRWLDALGRPILMQWEGWWGWGLRWIRDGRDLILAQRPTWDYGAEVPNRVLVANDDDGHPVLLYRAAEADQPARSFLLLAGRDDPNDRWLDAAGRVHSTRWASNRGGSTDTQGLLDASGQGPLEPSPLYNMHNPLSLGAFVVAPGSEVVDVGGSLYSPALARTLEPPLEAMVARNLRASVVLNPMLTGGASLAPFDPSDPSVEAMAALNRRHVVPEPTVGELALGVLEGLVKVGIVSAIVAAGGWVAGGSLLVWTGYASIQRRRSEREERGQRPLESPELALAVASDVLMITDASIIVRGVDPVNDDEYRARSRIQALVVMAAGQRLASRVSRHIHREMMTLVAQEVRVADLDIIAREGTSKAGGSLAGRVIRPVYEPRDFKQKCWFNHLDRVHGPRGPRGPGRMASEWRVRTVNGEAVHDRITTGPLVWSLGDAAWYWLHGVGQRWKTHGLIDNLRIFFRSGEASRPALQIWWDGNRAAIQQLLENYHRNKTLDRTRITPPYDYAQKKLPDDIDLTVNIAVPLGSGRLRRLSERLNAMTSVPLVDMTKEHMTLPLYFDTQIPMTPPMKTGITPFDSLREFHFELLRGRNYWRKAVSRYLQGDRASADWNTLVVTTREFAMNGPDFIKPSLKKKVTNRVPLRYAPDLRTISARQLARAANSTIGGYLREDDDDEEP